jgi:hypothetical protein
VSMPAMAAVWMAVVTVVATAAGDAVGATDRLMRCSCAA